MNRIDRKFQEGKKLLSIYFTAGYPALDDTIPILEALQEAGVDMIEIGLPFSDPLADGPTIQESSTQAIQNGMSTQKLLEQLARVRKTIEIPLVIMGYFNPILQFGVDAFCKSCAAIGVDGLIIPDLPVDVFHRKYQDVFERNGLYNMFLITPQTSEERIRYIDNISNGFIYMVSSAAVTGTKDSFGKIQLEYFDRIAAMDLQTPQIVGFGIGNAATFKMATKKADGAIIGSAFIQYIKENGIKNIGGFIKKIR